MPNLFDLYTVPPKTNSFDLPMLSATGINSVDTDLDFDYSFTPKPPAEAKEDLFKQALLKLGQSVNNAPAYTFTESMARRYDIPGLQYTPYKTAIGTDIEDLYAKNQAWYKQLGNGLLKMAGNGVGTFASSYLTIPATLDLVRDGKYVEAFQDDSLFSSVQEMLTNMEDVLPNYYSEWEREHPYLSAIPFGRGSANFYGDKILKNLGFTLGSIAAGITQGAIITLGTEGVGLPAGLARAGTVIATSLPKFFKAVRGVSKIAQSATAAKNLGTMMRVGKNMEDAIEASAGLVNLGKATKFITSTYLSAQGEAFIEGYHTYNEIKTNYYKQLLNNEIGLEEAQNIEQIAQDAGRYTTGINLVLLSLSNAIQFPKLLGGTPKNEFLQSFTKQILGKEGLSYAENYSLKKAWLRVGKEFAEKAVTEGGEEFSQAITSGAITDYYMDKYAPSREGIIYHIGKQFEKEGVYEEAFLGAISGAMMGGVSSIRENVINGKAKVRDAVNNINRAIGKLDDHARLVHSAVEEELSDQDKLKRQHASFKYKFNLARQGVRYGTLDSTIEAFRDAARLETNEFNKLFGTEFQTKEEQVQRVDSVIQELENYASVVKNVNTAFSKNPYSDENAISERLRRSLGGDPNKTKAVQEYLFEEWKGAMAYSIARVQAIDENLESIHGMMGTYGYNDESWEYLRRAAMGDKAVLPLYNQFKINQINAFLQEKQYLQQMQESATAASPAGSRPQDYQKKIEEIDEKIESINQTLKEVKELSAKIPDKIDPEMEEEINLIQEQLNYALFLAEANLAAILDKEEKKRMAEEAKRAAEEAATLSKEKGDLKEGMANGGERLAEDIVEAEERTGDQVAPEEEIPITEDPDAWVDAYEIGATVNIIINQDPVEFKVTRKDKSGTNEDTNKLEPATIYLSLEGRASIYELTRSEGGSYILSVDTNFKQNNDPELTQRLDSLGFKLEDSVYSKEVTIVESTQPQESQTDIETKKADIERRRQEALESLPFDETTQIKLDAYKAKDQVRYIKELIKAADKTIEGRTLVDKFDAELKLIDPNATIAEKVMARYFLADTTRPYSAAQLSDIEKYITNELSGDYKASWNDRLRELKKIYDAELAALEQTQPTAQLAQPQPQSQPQATQPAQPVTTAPAQPATAQAPNVIDSWEIYTETIPTDKINEEDFLFVGPKSKIREGGDVYKYGRREGKVIRGQLTKDGLFKSYSNQDNIPKILKQVIRKSSEKIYTPKAEPTQNEKTQAIIQNVNFFLGSDATEHYKAVLQSMAEDGLIEIQC
jgi:hypothetical protein